MEEDTPPPLPPKYYKLRKSAVKISANANDLSTEKSILDDKGNAETKIDNNKVNEHNENRIFNDIVNLDITKSAVSYFKRNDDLEAGNDSSSKSMTLNVGIHNDSLSKGVHLTKSLSRKSDSFHRTAIKKRQNKTFHVGDSKENFIDNLISKNLSEFAVKIENEKPLNLISKNLSEFAVKVENEKPFNLISKNLNEFAAKVENEIPFSKSPKEHLIKSPNIVVDKKCGINLKSHDSKFVVGSDDLSTTKCTVSKSNTKKIDLVSDRNTFKAHSLPIPNAVPPILPKPYSQTLPASVEDNELKEVQSKIEIFGSLFDKVIEANDDIIDFGKAITELRESFQYNDVSTNNGIIQSNMVKNILPNMTIYVHVFFESYAGDDGKIVKCEYTWTTNEITSQYLKQISTDESSLDLFLVIDQYIFKFVGFDLYLEKDVRLCDYAHVQEYVKQGKYIKLDLINKNRMCTNLARDHKDDLILNNCFINFVDYFEKPDSISVSEQGLRVLLESYNTEVTKLIDEVTNTREPDFMPDRMIQVVKAISTVLASIDIPEIRNAICLFHSLRSENNHECLPGHINENFEYESVPAPIYKFDKQIFDLALTQLNNGIFYLIELYSKSFELTFNLEAKKILPQTYDDDIDNQVDRANESSILERVDPRSLTDNFTLKIESIHRIQSEWKFNFIDFQLEVGLYYGGELLCPVQKCTKSTVDKGFFEHISFAKLIEFDISLRQIPRETKIGFVLHGLISPMNLTSLCWFTSNLYNYEGFLLSGSCLFGLISDVEFDPVATCATNYIHHCDAAILKVDFQIYPVEVMFPQPILFLPERAVCESSLNESDLNNFQKILRKDMMYLNEKDKSFIWNNRLFLSKYPNGLIYVLLSVPSWDAESVLLVHNTLNYWKQLTPHNALKLLEGKFPDKVIREHAIAYLNGISDDELFDYLPGLVQALKYEAYHNSALARFLIKRSLRSVRVCHHLYWFLKYYVEDIQFCQRYKTIISGLLHVCGRRLRMEFAKQDNLINTLTRIANLVKETKDNSRKSILKYELEKLNYELDSPYRIPYDPAINVCRILPDDCSYFSSFTVPLKIAFKNEDPLGEDVNVIYKVGDDLRKDLLTLQLFRIMNNLWLSNGLDLKIMLYNVLPTAPSAGLIEIVPNASTFREIHIQYGGVTGSFKDDSLCKWLQQFNSTKVLYEKAIDNFTASAAGYCVATYILGIGDRHNDNIMITKNGHLFHIDFSKYMGDIQKFGSIKRDRVPFVLTSDMAYVINNGITPSHNFQKFTEYCCLAFNIIRRHRSKLLNILRLMMYSDIAYVSTKADLEYVYDALQLHLSDEEAEVYFSQLIQNSLSSVSTQLNFFIHNVAHMKDSLDFDFRKLRPASGFTFSNQIHTFERNKGVVSARVVDFQKRYIPNKYYVFVVNIIQDCKSKPKFIFRSYDDFQELHTNVSNNFSVYPGIELPHFPPKIIIGRSEIREVAQERRLALDKYLVELCKIPRVWSSEIMATFLHNYIRDDEEEQRFLESVEYLQDGWRSRIGGKIKVSIVYEKVNLKIFITHVSNLVPRHIQGLADSYVKSYLLPDFMKHSKRKSKLCRKSLNPTFNETFMYNTPIELLKNRVLQVSVWDQVTLTEKEFLGGFHYYLSEFDPTSKTSCWFTLSDIDLNS